MKAKAAAQWEQLQPCCARPGLARNLRSSHVHATRFSDPEGSGILKGLALSSKITVADCELQHARNRSHTCVNGRSGYPALCVSSILDEAQLQHLQAVKGARLRELEMKKQAALCLSR